MEEKKLTSRVKVSSLLSVVSSKPTEPGKLHRFSPFDQAMGLHHTVHVVFYYESNPFDKGPMTSDIDNLRISLSYLLNQYPSATGRLTRDPEKGGWQVKCNDAGVRMLKASVSSTLDGWLRSADAVEERELMAWEEMPQDPSFWSPFRIQINTFECGGLAIAISCTHMHADITSATLLIKSWTEVHRSRPLTHPPTLHLPPPTHSKNNPNSPFSKPNFPNTPSKTSTTTMRFSDSSIKKRLSQVQKQCPNATPFDVLVALLWSRIAQFQEPPLDDNKHSLSICLDSRNHGNPTIPFNYFGNAMHFSTLSLNSKELLSVGLGQVSESIHEHVSGLKGEDFWSFKSWLEGEGPFKMYGPHLTCVNGEHMIDENGERMMYAAIFDKGKSPLHVSYGIGNVEGDGLIFVMPSPEPGLGRTVTVTLPEEQLVKLCEDQEIFEMEPTWVINGRG